MMVTIHKNTLNKFAVFKSSILSLLPENPVFLCKITYDTTKEAKVVKLAHTELSRMFLFQFSEGVEDLQNGIISLSGFGHYHFELYANDVYISNLDSLTMLYKEKMKLV